MNIKKLKEIIANLPDEMEVVLQKDSEGNRFSPLLNTNPNSIYIPNNTYSGTVYSTEWTADDADMTEEEWEELKSKPRVLTLTPRA